jgi:23S rRNA (guanosine2251-2'-O)-methyltransferase
MFENKYLCAMEGQKKMMNELDRKTIKAFHESKKIPIVVVLDEVRSMHNVGSVFRTADSFLIESIYLCGLTPQPPHRDIQKTALGATETVTWKHVETTQMAIDELNENGYKVIAVEQVHGSKMLHEFEVIKNEKYALVFGHEVNGVQQHIVDESHAVIEIPQLGSKHSLNISVSTGIVIWEFAKAYVDV